MTATTTCEQRITEHMQSRLDDLRLLYETDVEIADDDELADILKRLEDFGTVPDFEDDLDAIYTAIFEARCEYGLWFDYVAPNTFDDQEYGFFRYQLSTGDPGDEFRFYVDLDKQPYRIEYVFLDWFDGATRTLYDGDKSLLMRVFEEFQAIGMVDSEYDKATE